MVLLIQEVHVGHIEVSIEVCGMLVYRWIAAPTFTCLLTADVEVYDNPGCDSYDFLTLKMADGMSLKGRWFFKSPLNL